MSEPLAKLEDEMAAAIELCCETGVFFSFRLPKSGLSLRKISLVDGTPKLFFDSADSIDHPTITEEDVAVMARLVAEGTRPEFYYIPIAPGHPFHGRQYKQYKPSWLRGTSVGETLSEADWKMKCLSIGAKTNASKTKFWAASKTSKLEGHLGTVLDFPSSNESGSIKMSCKSVAVKETSDNLSFVGEPKMQIIDDSSAAYTKYITEMYDSIAFYDEPLYLKMKELIKLVLAMEFLKKRGVKFDREWYMAASSKRSAASQAIEVSEGDIPEIDFRELPDHLPSAIKEEIKITAATKTGVQYRHTDTPDKTCAISIKDYDLLYKDMDLQEPVALHLVDGPIVPADVNSWKELYRETVPWPRVWKFPFPAIMTAGGGVTTSHISTRHVTQQPSKSSSTSSSGRRLNGTRIGVEKSVKRDGQYEKHDDGSLSVLSSNVRTTSSTKPPSEDLLSPSREDKSVRAPPRIVNPNAKQSHRIQSMEKAGYSSMYGYKDEGTVKVYNDNGELILQGESMKFASQTKDKNGEETSRVLGQIPFPILPHQPNGTADQPQLVSTDDCGSDTRRYTFVSPIGSGDEMDED